MSGFQAETLRTILETIETSPSRGVERGVVVTASTGAGKTYAFFLPVLLKLILERSIRKRQGVKAICIYPRVALSENQLTDFIEILYFLNQELTKQNLPNITIGLESGAAVYRSSDFSKNGDDDKQTIQKMRGWAYSNDAGGYLSPFAYCVGTIGKACQDTPQRLVVRPVNNKTLLCPICDKLYPYILFARDVMSG